MHTQLREGGGRSRVIRPRGVTLICSSPSSLGRSSPSAASRAGSLGAFGDNSLLLDSLPYQQVGLASDAAGVRLGGEGPDSRLEQTGGLGVKGDASYGFWQR